jgi:SAM-dependent methyltransferase
MNFFNFLKNKKLANIEVDSEELLYIQKDVLESKSILKEVFKEFYDLCIKLDKEYFYKNNGPELEIGSGTSIFKKFYPEILSSDIKFFKELDIVINVQTMPLRDNSVHAFYGINIFHHLPYPEKFFSELIRTLKPGGGCILIEPYFGLTASIFYKHIFETETFIKNQPSWNYPTEGPMKGANQALSYIVFVRDKKKFDKLYPELEILYIKPLRNYLRYLLSGGLNFISLIPDFMVLPVKLLEFLLKPVETILALHYIIVIRKRVYND